METMDTKPVQPAPQPVPPPEPPPAPEEPGYGHGV